MFMNTIVMVRKGLINQVRHNIINFKFNLRMVKVHATCVRMESCKLLTTVAT